MSFLHGEQRKIVGILANQRFLPMVLHNPAEAVEASDLVAGITH